MATFLKPCWSSKARGGGQRHALDNEEFIKKGNNLLNWKIPKVPTSKIYKTNPFNFLSDPSIKTKQVEMACGNGTQATSLILESPFIASLRSKRFYSMFNVGMIQIGAKTLTKKIPLNATITLCVFDTRTEKFEDSILGMVEARLWTKPIRLTWRTCYKLQNSALAEALIESRHGRTVFFQTDFENSDVAVPKVSIWDDVLCKVLDLFQSEK
ncbi:hypothetical protein SDJN03_16759, partial [Cucurbita argyrosperma subsp. sororia]